MKLQNLFLVATLVLTTTFAAAGGRSSAQAANPTARRAATLTTPAAPAQLDAPDSVSVPPELMANPASPDDGRCDAMGSGKCKSECIRDAGECRTSCRSAKCVNDCNKTERACKSNC